MILLQNAFIKARLLFCITTTFFLISCEEVLVPDGRIPLEYLNIAKNYQGSYSGYFQNIKGEFQISFNNDKPVLSYQNKFGDILSPQCESQFGILKKLQMNEVSPGQYELTHAVFEFDSNKCREMILGQEVIMDFYKENNQTHISVLILKNYDKKESCVVSDEGGSGESGSKRDENCTILNVPVYLKGKYKRQQSVKTTKLNSLEKTMLP